jgi:putative oxidoreductase
MFPILFLFDQYAFLLLRVAVGVIFLVHGIPKLKDLTKTAQGFEMMGFKPGRFWGTLVAILEVVGGLLLIAGLLVQPLGALFAFEMLVAIVKVRRSAGFVGGWEFEGLLLVASLALLILGGGQLSLESMLGFAY